MKRLVLSVFTFVFLLGSANLIAQESSTKEKVKKDIKVTDKNGDVQVTIKETKDGKVTKQVLKGEEAEEYLKKETEGSALFLESDDDTNVIIMKVEGDDVHGHSWISDEDIDIDIDMGELNTELEKLRDELEELNKEEIAIRLDEIMEMREEMTEMHVIKMEELHHNMDDLLEISENIEVEVVEEDGVMIITKTIGDTEIVKEIIIEDEGKGNKVVVMKSSKGISDRSTGSTGSFDVNVYPNPSDGNFFIDLELKKDKEASVKVVDASGKEVYKKNVQGSSEHKLEVKLKKPSAGVYVIIVEQGKEMIKLKTIVE